MVYTIIASGENKKGKLFFEVEKITKHLESQGHEIRLITYGDLENLRPARHLFIVSKNSFRILVRAEI